MSVVRPRALLVDDEPDIRELLAITLERMNIDCVEADSLAAARRALESGPLSLCLTDMRLPDGSGIELVRHIQSKTPHLPVAVITAHGSMELAIEALKAGAFDFVSKPVDLQGLRALVNAALRAAAAPTAAAPGSRTLIGDSPGISEMRVKVARLARSQAPVYVSGESGTGKELVARMIHDQGPRAAGPFVALNCGAIAPDLIESELFGHRRGSFTGAHADRIGLFEAADGGTLFLDEVADLPLAMQVKLLRAIQEKRVRPVGGHAEIAIDARVVSATHRNLAEQVRRGHFREDLFYRINVIELHVPALRERLQDVPALARYLLTRSAAAMGEAAPRLDEVALERLCTHAYPGNVRELENILERAMALSDGQYIRVEDLGLDEAQRDARPPRVPGQTLDAYLAHVEVHAIEAALAQADGNKSAAARRLGLKLGALRYRMQKLGME